MIATRHPRLREAVMMDVLRDLDERGSNVLPDQHEIMARFDFADTEQARTLIAQMADGGIIRVARHSGYSTFTILPPKPPRCAVSTVNRMVEADEVEDVELDAVDRKQIDRALSRIKRTMAPVPAPVRTKMPSRPQPETVVAMPGSDQGAQPALPPAQVAETVLDSQLDQSQPVEARHPWLSMPAASLPRLSYVELSQWAANHDLAPTKFGRLAASDVGLLNGLKAGRVPGDRVTARVRHFMAEYLPDKVVSQLSKPAQRAIAAKRAYTRLPTPKPLPPVNNSEPPGKPRVRAEIVKAWRNDGRPFDQFLTALLDLGLESYLEFRAAA